MSCCHMRFSLYLSESALSCIQEEYTASILEAKAGISEISDLWIVARNSYSAHVWVPATVYRLIYCNRI